MELTHKILTQDKEFIPLVTTYAISAGRDLNDRWEFDYFLFEVNNGFEDAIAKASPPIQKLVKVNGGIEPKPARITRLSDEDGNTVKVELRHPDYSPYNSNAPLMFIQVQALDEEIVDAVTVTIPKQKELESGTILVNSGGNERPPEHNSTI